MYVGQCTLEWNVRFMLIVLTICVSDFVVVINRDEYSGR
jgi:hypothetical protein